MTEYETMTKSIIVKRKGEPIFDVCATEISAEDEAGGLFVCVRQYPDNRDQQEIRIGEEDWPHILLAIERMLNVCREHNEEGE